MRLSALAGGIHANTARPRTAKNLAWKIANVLLCRTVLNNDREERNQMRNRKASTAEKRGTETGTEMCGAAALQELSPAPLCAAHLAADTAQHTPERSTEKSAQGTGWTGQPGMDFHTFILSLENGANDKCGVDRKIPSESTLRISPGLKTMSQPLNND